MFIKELVKILLQGGFLILIAYIGNIYFNDDRKSEKKHLKIISSVLNILK